ncbi:MAG TPA: Gfo/Idh/MocA family oxidoreductase [Gemmatimonadaceae bacterium]|nr:Gfo/Idh/MocA family oxidoreductase [Gemmatimonadaceae bacterium]
MSIRILQVGTGIRGGHWVDIVESHPDVQCVGYVDRDERALASVRARVPGNDRGFFTDLDAALAATRADAALIVTPSALHADHTCRALRAGLAVMVEKPLATSVEEAERVLEASRAAGRPVVVAENYRYWPAERTVRALIQAGRIGRVDSATLIDRRHMPSHTEGPWLASIEYPHLQEIAVHHFDSLRAILGRAPSSITARAWNAPWSDYRHGAATEAFIDLAGIHVQYLGTLTSHRFAFSLWIEGEHGVLWTNRKYVAWRRSGSRFFRPVRRLAVPRGDEMPYPRGGTTSLLNALHEATTKGVTAETHAGDNIWNVAMIEAAKRSDRERRTVSIEEVWPASSAARTQHGAGAGSGQGAPVHASSHESPRE